MSGVRCQESDVIFFPFFSFLQIIGGKAKEKENQKKKIYISKKISPKIQKKSKNLSKNIKKIQNLEKICLKKTQNFEKS